MSHTRHLVETPLDEYVGLIGLHANSGGRFRDNFERL